MDNDIATSYQAITPEQHNRIENESVHIIPAAADVAIPESGVIDSTTISESRASDLSGNNIVPSTPSQGRMIDECRIVHKSGNVQTIRKMETSHLFSEKVARIDSNNKDHRRLDNTEKQKGA